MISKTILSSFLGALLGKASVSYGTVYMALSTADPTVDGSGISEPSGNGYARKVLTTSYGLNGTSHAFGTVSNSLKLQDHGELSLTLQSIVLQQAEQC